MTRSEFAQIEPNDGESLLLFDFIFSGSGGNDSLYDITSISIHRTSCSQEQISTIGSQLGKIAFEYSGSKYNTVVSDEIQFPRHINYKIQPVRVASTVNIFAPGNPDPLESSSVNCGGGLNTGDTLPSYSLAPTFNLDNRLPPLFLDIGYTGHIKSGSATGSLPIQFEKSDFNVLYNNTEVRSTDKKVFKVSSTKNGSTVSNLTNIINDYAVRAEIQEYNYTSAGLKHSRYDGTKTHKGEFGTEPALSLVEFQGAIYDATATVYPTASAFDTTTAQDNFICSQSVEDREYKSYYFARNLKPGIGSNTKAGFTFKNLPEVSTVQLALTTRTDQTFDSSATTLEISSSNAEVGDTLVVVPFLSSSNNSNKVEYLEIESVSLDTPISGVTTYTVRRNIFDYLDENNSTAWSGAGTSERIYKLVPDSIYELEGSRLVRVADKKLFVKETGEIFFINNNGEVTVRTKKC